ncbi:UNVERIFIED_CONTAM: hypothetical protein ABID98_001870 [Brevibacillus sp. OAP136]
MSVPITNQGHSKGYTFIGNFSLYPLNWTEEEALAFSLLASILEPSNRYYHQVSTVRTRK